MYNMIKKLPIIITVILFFSTITIYATEASSNQNSVNTLTQESSATTLEEMKQEQLGSLEYYKTKYGSDSYGLVAYILNLVQIYSIPLGILGVAICAILQYVIGLKRLDIRDKGFSSMIAVITIIIICQILPLIFAIATKSTD
ncbi:MAG: hypothetical protein J6A89_09185 [Clostridia bacterium]|nr:hypothetical protein [Clostridia bacterium]